ncbi:hypothetical protein [Parvularcula marina]|uniref:hypothetical protein n=1 Tax=Parvularcula marina TaxID=2292771 RepID=UPI0035169BE1
MGADYHGPHRFEWGWLTASIFAVAGLFLMFLLMLLDMTASGNDSSRNNLAMGFVTMLSVAIAVATDMWIQWDDIYRLLMWGLPIIYIPLILWGMSGGAREKYSRIILWFALLLGYAGLVGFILMEMILEISFEANLNKTTIDVYSLLSPVMRNALLHATEVILLITIWAMWLSIAVSACGVFGNAVSELRKHTIKTVSLCLIILLFIGLMFVNLIVPYGHDIWSAFSFYDAKYLHYFVTYLLGAVLVVVIMRRGEGAMRNRKLPLLIFLIVASYSYSPIISSAMPNEEYPLFWASVILLMSVSAYYCISGFAPDRLTSAAGPMYIYLYALFLEIVFKLLGSFDSLSLSELPYQRSPFQAFLAEISREFFIGVTVITVFASLLACWTLYRSRHVSSQRVGAYRA